MRLLPAEERTRVIDPHKQEDQKPSPGNQVLLPTAVELFVRLASPQDWVRQPVPARGGVAEFDAPARYELLLGPDSLPQTDAMPFGSLPLHLLPPGWFFPHLLCHRILLSPRASVETRNHYRFNRPSPPSCAYAASACSTRSMPSSSASGEVRRPTTAFNT